MTATHSSNDSSKTTCANRCVEAEKKVKNILNKYEKIGVTDKDFAKIWKTFVKETKKTSSTRYSFKMKTSLIFTIFFMIMSLYYYMDFREDDRCWIDLPQFIIKATRPPEPCSMCSDVTVIERVANLTPTDFEEKYAYNGRPIVVTDAAINWTAIKMFDFEFFKKIYTETDLGEASRDCQFFPYKTEFRNLYDALQMDNDRANLTEGTKPWYIGWSNCHDKVAKILRQHYGRPYFLPESAENNAIDWIFMGGPGFGAQMHVDSVVHPSWQAQLRGRKKWQLAPPPECFYSCIFIETIVHPGEIIVLDTNRWYHKTEVLPGGVSITIGAEYD